MNLSSVTVIIPAHNRPQKLRRLLHYYYQTNIEIIVADSSDLPITFLNEFPNLKYFYFPKEQFIKKIYLILPYISTKYVVYCADDDFIVPQAIEQIVSFLDENSDYDSAQGHYLSYEVKRKKANFFPSYIRNFEKNTNQATPSERLLEYKNLYASLLYSVIRSSTFIEMYKQCIDREKLKFSNLFLAELYFNFFSLMSGKNTTLPIFYGAREKDYHSATYTTIPLNEIQQSPQHKDEYQNFCNILIHNLTTKQKISNDEAKIVINKILSTSKRDNIHPLKRKIISLLEGNSSAVMKRMLRKRYIAKGLKNTKGMKSYPCTFSTPEKEDIIHHILLY